MSSILDALKKSERQRRHGEALIFRQTSPDAAPVLLRPALAALAGLALIATIATAAYVWMRPTPVASPVAPVANNTVPGPAPAPAPAPTTASTSAPAEDLAEQADVDTATRTTPTPAAPLSASTTAPRAVAAAGPAGFDQVPWLSSLPEVFRNSLPPLTVNIHVYTPEESQRILYINNRPVRRGEQIEGGVTMEEIVQDGVILRYRGQLFKLPRPK